MSNPIDSYIKSKLEKLSRFQLGTSNVFLLLKSHDTGKDIIELTFALVSGFESEYDSVIYEQFHLFFNKQQFPNLYENENVNVNLENFGLFVLSKILKQYTIKNIERFVEKTSHGLNIGQFEQEYKRMVIRMLYTHIDFLTKENSNKDNSKELVNYFLVGDQFKKIFPDIGIIKTSKSLDILLNAIELAAIGAISIAALRKLFTFYESKRQKTSSMRPKTSSTPHKTKKTNRKNIKISSTRSKKRKS